jgi:hypothetical protein
MGTLDDAGSSGDPGCRRKTKRLTRAAQGGTISKFSRHRMAAIGWLAPPEKTKIRRSEISYRCMVDLSPDISI